MQPGLVDSCDPAAGPLWDGWSGDEPVQLGFLREESGPGHEVIVGCLDLKLPVAIAGEIHYASSI